MFSAIYTHRVLEPAYINWRTVLLPDFFRVQKAHLIMLTEQGIIQRDAALAIKKGIDAIEKESPFPERIPAGVEDIYFLFEQKLTERIGSELSGQLHTARSRNDMDTAILRLYLRRRLLKFLRVLQELILTISHRIREDGNDLIVLYTHGQPANVSTLGHYFSAFALEIFEGIEQLRYALHIVDLSPMGACALTTTGFPIHRERMAELLGFVKPVYNSYQAISGGHWLLYPSTALRGLLSDITRFVMDLSHKASCEVGLLSFPDELVQVSSIMPQKRNPVILEHVRIQAGLGMGILGGIETLFHNTPYQDVNEVADAPVFELDRAIHLGISCVELLEEIFQNIQIEQERVKELSEKYYITATELADTLVRDQGLDFRSAHKLVSEFVHAGGDLDTLRQIFAQKVGRRLLWTDTEIREILSPERFVKVRKIIGGPASEGMAPVIERIDTLNTDFENFISEMEARDTSSEELIHRCWTELTS